MLNFDTMQDGDWAALALLSKAGYKDRGGILYHPEGQLHHETSEQSEAIDYLCSEWDYGWVANIRS